MRQFNDWTNITTKTFPEYYLKEILKGKEVCSQDIHVQYPADGLGVHLNRFFSIKNAVKNAYFIQNTVYDIGLWKTRENLDFDIIFAPNQPIVRKIIETLVSVFFPNKRMVFLEYLPTGRFGDKLVSGEIKPGDRVLVYNAVSIQGRCIGERLPSFTETLGGEVVAIACFAKGTAPKVRELEEKWGAKFYSAIQIDIPVYKPEDCPMCKAGEKLIPWTEL